MTEDSLNSGGDFDQVKFAKYISNWEWQWVNKQMDFPVEMGNSIDQSVRLYRKYNNEIRAAYPD
jgi:hypothetical protein